MFAQSREDAQMAFSQRGPLEGGRILTPVTLALDWPEATRGRRGVSRRGAREGELTQGAGRAAAPAGSGGAWGLPLYRRLLGRGPRGPCCQGLARHHLGTTVSGRRVQVNFTASLRRYHLYVGWL